VPVVNNSTVLLLEDCKSLLTKEQSHIYPSYPNLSHKNQSVWNYSLRFILCSLFVWVYFQLRLSRSWASAQPTLGCNKGWTRLAWFKDCKRRISHRGITFRIQGLCIPLSNTTTQLYDWLANIW